MEGPFDVGSRFGLEINAVPQYPLQVHIAHEVTPPLIA